MLQEMLGRPRLLLDRGANPNARASLRAPVQLGNSRVPHEARNVTPIAWCRNYPKKILVSESAIRMIAGRGGV